MHYDLFDGNRGYRAHVVESVEREHPGVAVFVPPRDRPFVCTSEEPR